MGGASFSIVVFFVVMAVAKGMFSLFYCLCRCCTKGGGEKWSIIKYLRRTLVWDLCRRGGGPVKTRVEKDEKGLGGRGMVSNEEQREYLQYVKEKMPNRLR
jgi:hypothetical protein